MVPAERTRGYSYTYASRHTISSGHGAGHIIPGAEMTAGFRRTTGSGTRTRAKTILGFNSKATSGLNRFTALLMLTSDSDAWCPHVYGITHAYLRLGRLVALKSMEVARLAVLLFYVLAGGLEVLLSIAPVIHFIRGFAYYSNRRRITGIGDRMEHDVPRTTHTFTVG